MTKINSQQQTAGSLIKAQIGAGLAFAGGAMFAAAHAGRRKYRRDVKELLDRVVDQDQLQARYERAKAVKPLRAENLRPESFMNRMHGKAFKDPIGVIGTVIENRKKAAMANLNALHNPVNLY